MFYNALVLIASFISIGLFGSLILDRFLLRKLNFYAYSLVSFLIGLVLFLCSAHYIAFLTQSFARASLISLSLILGVLIISWLKASPFFQYLSKKASIVDYFALGFASLLSYLVLLRDQVQGIFDCKHVTVAANLASNNYYPPRLYMNEEKSFDFFHYGVDDLYAFVKAITNGLTILEVNTILVVVFCFTLISSLYILFSKITKSKQYAFFATVFISTFVSVLSYEFFPLYIQLGFLGEMIERINEIFTIWLAFSNFMSPIVDSTRTTTVSLGYTLTAMVLFLLPDSSYYRKNLFYYSTVFTLFICLALTYPACLYPMVCGYFAYLVLKFIKTKFDQSTLTAVDTSGFKFILIAVLAKFISLSQSATTINGVQTMIWKPRLTWVPSFHAFLMKIFSSEELRAMPIVFDPRRDKYYLELDVFSEIAMRGFLGLLILAGILLLISFLMKKNANITLSFSCFIAACISTVLPLLFYYTLSPAEIDRFFVVSILFSSISILISFAKIFLGFPKALKLVLVFVLLFFNIPGLTYYFPIKHRDFQGIKINEEKKYILKTLDSIQESGQRILALTPGKTPGYDVIGLSGFFAIGGEVYKSDLFTQKTAFKTLDFGLLNELEVDYILYSPENTKPDFTNPKLQDDNAFQEIEEVSLATKGNYKLYKYTAQQINNSKQNFVWLPGYQDGSFDFNLVRFKDQIFVSKTREGMILSLKKVKKELVNNPEYIDKFDKAKRIYNRDMLTYIRPQAFTFEAFQYLKLNKQISLSNI